LRSYSRLIDLCVTQLYAGEEYIKRGVGTEEVSAVDGVEVFREPGDLQLTLLHERRVVQ